MEDFCDILEQLYKKVLLGATLENDNQDYVFYLNPVILDQDDSTATCSEFSHPLRFRDACPPSSGPLATTSGAPVCSKRRAQTSSAREILLLQLTVTEVMLTRALNGTEFPAKEKYREIIQTLLKSSALDSKLASMFQNSDKLLSHMAAKCLARFLYFQLKEKKTLSNSWVAFCQNNLSEYSESDKIVYCLWTLAVVIKEIFKDTHSQKTEILKQFLTCFDSLFEDFYNSLFSQRFENCQDATKIVNTLMCFLDLLELLIVSRTHLESQFPCQRILFWRPSCVLDVITWPVQAFVKRKVIIFIKKCLLWKVGEDLCRGSVPAFTPSDCHLDADMSALADAVLRAVDLGLLRTLSVHGRPSRFGGGDVPPGWEPVPVPDHVILRAASLFVVKSLEIKFQNCASANEMKGDLQKFMSELLAFLGPHLRPSLLSHSPCGWLCSVFMEQDDDMIEAARATLGIYLTLARECEATESLSHEKEAWDHHTHENGYNPHCIFLFFLKNIGFDATVLLDFLISSETCFLEYFVRYLKLLQKDWHQFFTICKSFDVTKSNDGVNTCGCVSSLVQDRSGSRTEPGPRAACGSHRKACALVSWPSDASAQPPSQAVVSKEIHATLRADGQPLPQASQSLVDYDSSDDSEVESRDPCSANSKQTSLYQEAVNKIQDADGTIWDKSKLSQELRSRPLVPKESNTPFSVDCDIVPNSSDPQGGTACTAVKCFEELQGAIHRLQKKNLFPYNPTALTKLLKQTKAMYNKTMNPL